MINTLLNNAFWPALAALLAVTLATFVVVDFVIYASGRYRERFLQEAATELDDVLLQLPAGRILDLSFALSAVAGFMTFLLLSATGESFEWIKGLSFGVIAAVAVFPVPRLALRYMRKQRLAKFNIQLEDALTTMSSALKAGFSINQALEEIANGKKHPIAVEFRLLTQEIRLGVPLEQALDNMTRRLGSDDFELASTAIIVARQTGGELTSTLERLSAMIRERIRISQKLQAITALGRLQAWVIGVMPFVLLFALAYVAPDIMNEFLNSALGIIALIVVFILDIIGFLVIRKITTIDV